MIIKVIYGCEITALDLNIIESCCDNKYLLHNPRTGQNFFGFDVMRFDTNNPTQMISDNKNALGSRIAHILSSYAQKYYRENYLVNKEYETFCRVHDYPRGYYIWRE